ncbi:hypothetical protein DJ021_06355 [Phenylobacterium hankyongense]|uniref:Chemotaxis protein CheU n=1 Tax=Phenylobacterium hankyongense TaxID=1813876 RepID=A0A328AWE6_9CAUL|nr:hypothetical protein [Phenylobacterium hankyongense]RAK59452.1 hypothetical protein DJ021_06355 [Phenylobacterium hankyongense]
MPPLSSPEVPLSQVLATCAGELADLAARCGRLQTTLSPALARTADLEDGQALDLVTQTLEALSAYMGALGRGLPAAWTADAAAAAAGLPLADLAARLQGLAAAAAADSGELDLFEAG